MQLTPLELAFNREQQRITDARLTAGWTLVDGAWTAPDGTGPETWEAEGLPLPEHEGYEQWAGAYWHYEHLDSCT